jgi:hypothetical protein
VGKATHTITIELELAAGGFAGEAHDAKGAAVPFSGWLGLIAALDTLIAADGEHAFALPRACCSPLATEATALGATPAQEGTTR